jgi:hypothetical protein
VRGDTQGQKTIYIGSGGAKAKLRTITASGIGIINLKARDETGDLQMAALDSVGRGLFSSQYNGKPVEIVAQS